MKRLYIILPIFLILASCSSAVVDYAIINGKVQRAINGEGIANQSLYVMTRKSTGSGFLATKKILDQKRVLTDQNGNFSVALVREAGAFVTVVYEGDADYFGTAIYRDYSIDEPVIIETDKLIKFKILVKNTKPFDENDFIYISFFAGFSNVRRTGIENYGVANTYRPEQPSPGGVFGSYEETSWTGMDVNSIIHYSVRESAEHFKIQWIMKKNGTETNGFTDDIPYNINEVNSFSYEY